MYCRNFSPRIVLMIGIFTWIAKLTVCSSMFIGRGLATFTHANQLCEELGEKWHLPNGQKDTEELARLMRNEGLGTLWLGIIRKRSSQWTWVNNKIYFNFSVNKEEHACAAIGIDEEIHSVPCRDQTYGFLCEAMKSQQCPVDHFKQVCIPIDAKYAILGCEARNWYDARSLCKSYGTDLAVLDTAVKIKAVTDHIVNNRLTSTCDWLHIGLYRELWVYVNDTEGAYYPDKVFWEPSEPSTNIEKKCLVAILSGRSLKWRAQVCTDHSNTVCQQDENNTDDKVTVHTTTEMTVATVVVSLLLGISLVLYIPIIFYIKKRKRSSARWHDPCFSSCHTSNHTPDLLEMESIVTLSESANLEYLQDTITVVLFSTLPNTEQSQHFVKVFLPNLVHKEQDETFSSDVLDILQSEVGVHGIRVVCIYCCKNKLSKDETNIILKYLQTNVKAIDIVCLPGLTYSEETLQLFQQLRDEIVFISQAVKGVTDAVSTESISFGITKTRYNLKTKESLENGIVDFTINCDCKGSHNIRVSKEMVSVVILAAKEVSDAKSKLEKGENDDAACKQLKSTGAVRRKLIDMAREHGKSVEHYEGFGQILLSEKTKLVLKEQLESKLLNSNKSKTRTKLKIVLGGTGIDKTNSELDGWNILDIGGFQLEDEDDANKSGTMAAIMLTKALRFNKSFRRYHVEIFDAQLIEDGRIFSWNHYKVLLDAVVKLKPNIVYLPPGIDKRPVPSSVQKLIYQITQHSVVVTSARLCEVSDVLTVHPEFPSDSCITVYYDIHSNDHRHNKPHPMGATVDFVVKTVPLDNFDYIWSGAIQVVWLVYNILDSI